MKVLIADKFPDAAAGKLEDLGCEVVLDPALQEDALTEDMVRHQPNVLIVRSTKVQREQLEASPELGLVVRAGAGVNTIDVAEASRRGIWVANCPGKNAVAVAELAFAHLLALDRQLVDGALDLRQGIWNKKKYGQARGIHGRTLGLLGLGGIGREMVGRAQAFGMKVIAWSRSLTDERAAELGVARAENPVEVARRCDVLSLHLALNDDTRGLVGAEILAALPEGALVINTSRGDVVDQPALAKAIRVKGLRAGLDVFADEPSGGEGSLEPGIFALPGVQGSHHIGASTAQAQDAVAAEAVRVVAAFFHDGSVPNCVNLAERGTATHLLVVRHRDQVGVLAGVLDALREAGINVQEMENLLFAGGGAASARIQIDRAPSRERLQVLEDSNDGVLAVSVSEL